MAWQVFKNPIARKRFQRFKEIKRAYVSFWILTILYLISLGAEVICNSDPLYVRFNGNSYFPVFRFYPEDVFAGNGLQTRPNYHKLKLQPMFRENPANYMVFPLFGHGPLTSIDPDMIEVPDQVTVVLAPLPMIGTVNIRSDNTIARSKRFGTFVGSQEQLLKGQRLDAVIEIPKEIRAAIQGRFNNRKMPPIAATISIGQHQRVTLSLSTFRARQKPPPTVRLTLREAAVKVVATQLVFNRQLKLNSYLGPVTPWRQLTPSQRETMVKGVEKRFLGPIDTQRLTIAGRVYTVEFRKMDVRFPFHPVKGHWLGIDGAGRDVFARVLYGLRTSMSFGLLLVFFSYVLGILAGALQGYYGGALDISAQRLIEIWSALPFLYIMILMGSVYGRSFSLLLFCYALFNWIGISYYIRAEFLRLRQQPFVEAAKCMGIRTSKIIFRHILPNGLVPVITFFPFSLVGAIGALAALDYLGFGLPPPTPSWGELLFQAQQYRWAWWLILYPSVALFIVMLLGVFVGEGIRSAYDPKRFTRLE